MTPPCKLRGAGPLDRSRIAETWVHSHRASPLGRCMRPADYTRRMDAAINAILRRQPVVLVACDVGDPTIIMGWVCAEFNRSHPVILHYVWVSGIWRRCGLARHMLQSMRHIEDNPVAVSHVTDRALRIVVASAATRRLVGCPEAPHVRFSDLLALSPATEVAT